MNSFLHRNGQNVYKIERFSLSPTDNSNELLEEKMEKF